MKKKEEMAVDLNRYSLKPPPERIKRKILDTALKKENSRTLTPAFRALLVASLLLTVASLALDPDMGIVKRPSLAGRFAAIKVEKDDFTIMEEWDEFSILAGLPPANPRMARWIMKRMGIRSQNILEIYNTYKEYYHDLQF